MATVKLLENSEERETLGRHSGTGEEIHLLNFPPAQEDNIAAA
jgi:hypothetical protein